MDSGVAIGRSIVAISRPPTPATRSTPTQLRIVGAIGKRTVPVQRPAERRDEAVARERKLHA